MTQKVALILAENQLSAEQVTLEITESTLMQDPVKAKHELDLLDKLGVSLSVDDFGTGYSSLAYLKHLPVDEVKVEGKDVFEQLEHFGCDFVQGYYLAKPMPFNKN